jgi:radical SAM protein with 4Fe4S-binding SPASM domain
MTTPDAGRILRAMVSFGFQWHLTDRCNRRCAHCYQDDFTASSELSLGGLREIADRIFYAMPGRKISVNLTGGEPLLLPEFFTLAGRLNSFENLAEANIITNGTVTTDRVLDGIRSLPGIGVLKVSLESADQGLNDGIRGEGNFRAVSEGLDRLLLTGKPVVLMITLAKYNLGGIAAAVEFAKKRGLAGIIFERFVPLGSGRALKSEVLDGHGWRDAVEAIVHAAGVDSTPQDLLPYRAFWLWMDGRAEGVLEGAPCNLGDESMAVMPDGTVHPCRRLPIPVGNILSESFSSILSKLSMYGAGSIRRRLSGDHCGWCGVAGCAGCRALARALSGDYLSDDPQCLLYGDG